MSKLYIEKKRREGEGTSAYDSQGGGENMGDREFVNNPVNKERKKAWLLVRFVRIERILHRVYEQIVRFLNQSTKNKLDGKGLIAHTEVEYQ